jgi:hypothetical protein
VFVASSPDVFYFKDTDRDGRADVKPVVLTGFDVAEENQASGGRVGLCIEPVN